MFYKKIMLSAAVLSGSLLVATNDNSPVLHVTKDTYSKAIESTKPVIIDVYADWCSPCKAMKPVFHQFAEKYKDKYVCLALNFDEAKEIAESLGVQSLPSFVVMQKTKVLGMHVGTISGEGLKAKVEEFIETAGKSLNQLTKEQLNARLNTALQQCNVDEVTKLIDAGASVNDPLPQGMTPLAFAVANALAAGDNGIRMVKILLSKGAKDFKMAGLGGKMTAKEFINTMLTNATQILDVYGKLLPLFDEKTR